MVDNDSQLNPSRADDALIYLPGLGSQWYNRAADDVAARIATALDVTSPNPSARFEVEVPTGSRVPTIVRHDGDQQTRVLDVYRVDYRDELLAHWEQSNLFARAWRLALAIAASVPLAISALLRRKGRGRGKGRLDLTQLLYALGILALLSGYMGVLLVAVVQAVVAVLPAEMREAIPAVTGDGSRLSMAQLLVVVLTGLGAWSPKTREALASAATNYLAQVDYIRLGERHATVTDIVTMAVERVAERGPYRHIHLFGYSFGSIVAMDALFPPGREPTPRFADVDTLVTIGCPYDLLRSLWPDYFSDRHALPGVPRRWLNVHTPTDVLSSDFHDVDNGDDGITEVGMASGSPARPPVPETIVYTRGVAQRLNPLEWVRLMGFRVHSAYWGDQHGSSLPIVMQRLHASSQDAANAAPR